MKRSVVLLAVLITVCMVCCAHAEIYTLDIPATGYYTVSDHSRYLSVDFSESFMSIESLSIQLSGYVIPGWYEGLWFPGEPDPARFEVSILKDDATPARTAWTPMYGEITFPDPESFNVTVAFQPRFGYSSWDFLMDGQAELHIQLDAYVRMYGETSSYPPIGYLESATLILDATPIPEPAGVIVLASGIMGCVGILHRRRV